MLLNNNDTITLKCLPNIPEFEILLKYVNSNEAF